MHLFLRHTFNRFLEDVKYEDYQKYLSPELFERLIALDPTNRSYQSWILKTFINEFKPFLLKNSNMKPEEIPEIRKFLREDSYKVTEDLEKYDQLKRKNLIPNDKKDIFVFKTFGELWALLLNYSSRDLEVTKKKINPDDAEKIFENDEWLVVIPKTHEASCKYGANTRWCTASKDYSKHYKEYSSQGPLFILINKKTNKKYQFHFETESWMDEQDKPINLESFLSQLPWELKFSIYKHSKKFHLDFFLSLFSEESKEFILKNRFPILSLLRDEKGQENLQKIIEAEIAFLYENGNNIFSFHFFDKDIFQDIFEKFPLREEKDYEARSLINELDNSVKEFLQNTSANELDLYLSKNTYNNIVDRLYDDYGWDINSSKFKFMKYDDNVVFLTDLYSQGYITDEEYDEMYLYIYQHIILKEILKGKKGNIPEFSYFSNNQEAVLGLASIFTSYYAEEYARQYIGDNALIKKIAYYVEEHSDKYFNQLLLDFLDLKDDYINHIKQLDSKYNFLTPKEKKVLEITK